MSSDGFPYMKFASIGTDRRLLARMSTPAVTPKPGPACAGV